MRRRIIDALEDKGVAGVLRPLVRGGRAALAGLRVAPHHWARSRAIADYLASAIEPKVQLGASDKLLDGWLNTDLEPASAAVVQLDAARRFPFPDGVLAYVFGEHFIEHLSEADGARCLREVFRCLRPGGVVRLATPDLLQYARLLERPPPAEGQRFLEAFRRLYELPEATGCVAVNQVFYNWGHRFLYTPEQLEASLARAGFVEVRRVAIGESRHAPLRGVERHHLSVGGELNAYETMVVEAEKPSRL